MRNVRSTSLRSAALAAILSTSLVMGACSPKDKGPSAEKSAPATALGLKGPSDKAFAKHFAVPARNVPESEARQALAELNLLEKSGDALSWAKSSGKAGNYSYSGLSLKNDDGSLKIKKAELLGVHMEDDVASFDRADFSGITIYDEKEDVTVTMDTLSVARPTPDMVKAILTGLQNVKELDDLDLDIDDENADIGFGALGMGGLKINSDDATLTTKAFMWGEDEQTRLSDFKIEGISLKSKGEDEDTFTGSLGGFTATGLRTNAFEQSLKGNSSVIDFISRFIPQTKSYDTVKMSALNFDSDFITVSSKGFEAKATEKDGVTTMRQVSEPFIIRLNEAPKDDDLRQVYDLIKSLDFDEIVFQSSQTTVLDANTDKVTIEDGLVTMKNGFNLSYNYSASGLQAVTDKLDMSGDTGTTQDIQEALTELKLNGFQMRLEDRSIVERGLKLAAEMQGISPDSVKKELKLIMALAPFVMGGLEGEMIGEMSKPLSTFIENGGTLSIVMNPESPIPVSELANYKENDLDLTDLGFSAKAE